MSNEIASITVLVPHHIGTETINQVIPFRVYRQEQNYVAVPFISAAERLTSGLPESLSFALVNNRLSSTQALRPDVLENIVKELRLLHIV